MTHRVIIDEVADFEATLAAIAARTEQRDRDWIAEYLTTGMNTETVASGTCWDSADADVMGDLQRFIAAERERTYVPMSYDPLVLPPAYLDEYRQWCAHVYGTEDTELKRRAAERLNLHPGVRGLLSTRDVLTCEAAIDELRRSL